MRFAAAGAGTTSLVAGFMAIHTLALVVQAAPKSIDFDTQVVPILTKYGCNAASCHGAAAGRGGFKLSLFGGNATADWHAIAHELESRRVNISQPHRSLILLKPTEQLEHEGGLRFDFDSNEAALIETWIAQGARRTHHRALVALEVKPTFQQLRLHEPIQLDVTATFNDGLTQQVHNLAVYSPSDEAALKITESGELTVVRPGQHFVVVRFLDQVKATLLLAPVGDGAINVDDMARSNWIDDEVNAKLSALRIAPSPQGDRWTLARRLSLDLTGRLPAPDVAQRFATSEIDVDLFVDDLMQSDDFVAYWTYKFAKLLRVRTQPKETAGAEAFHRWLYEQLKANRPLDQVATTMLSAEGDTHEVGPANFYRVAAGAREQAEYVSEVLLGVRLRCANCHNHPLDRWTQDDYHGLAAIFAKVKQGRVIATNPRGEVTHPATGEPARPRIPGERFVDETSSEREELARWLISRENPYFAKALVNRVWKSMLGRGLVEPVDDLRDTNPATHPALLNRLTKFFVDSNFDLRATIKLVATSATYARSSHPTKANAADRLFYSHAIAKPLEAEVLADAITDVLGVAERYGDEKLGARAVRLIDSRVPSTSLDILGRCSRQDSCESQDASPPGITQKLHLLNGKLLNARINSKGSRLREHIDADHTRETTVVDFYRGALSREPTPAETKHWNERLTTNKSLEDFVWALLNSREFMTNH